MAATGVAMRRRRGWPKTRKLDADPELRTPLTALCALLENLADGVADPDPETLRAALDQGERMTVLVTDLLDLSRVDAGKAPLARETVEVRPLLECAVGLVRGRSVPSFLMAVLAWPLAGLRGQPGLGRTARMITSLGNRQRCCVRRSGRSSASPCAPCC